MGFVFRLEDYLRYLERVGGATCLDVTRRTDPACSSRTWDNLNAVVKCYGVPWIVQVWTKDAAGVLARGGFVLRRLLRYGATLSAQVTVTGLGGTLWEPHAPTSPFSGVAALISLLGGPDHVKWRYDPIIPSVHTMDRFRLLSENAASLGITRCVVNFIAPPGRYKRVDGRLSSVLTGWDKGMPGYDDAWQVQTVSQVVEVAEAAGVTVAACAESAKLVGQVPGLQPAACGDYAWFVSLSGRDPGRTPTTGSRPGCGCAAYFDVGLYGQRLRCHQCLYCYAG